MAYDRASQFLQQQKGNMAQYTPDYQPATKEFVGSIDKAMGGYQQQQQGSMDAYKGAMNQNVGLMKQQVQAQIQALQQQLSNNQAKYQSMADQQKSRIDRDYKKQNEAIDQQTFNQMKYNNAVGQQRGVSQSAQQTAMDNQVGQLSASLFNQNSQNRSDAHSDVDSNLMQKLVDLDNEFSKNYTSVMSNAINQKMAHNAQLAGKELEFSSAMADKLLSLEMQKGQITFESKMEQEKAKKALAQQIMQMTFSDYQQQDNRSFQSDEAQKNRDFQASENAKNRALQQAMAASRGGGSGSKKSGKADPTKEELLWNDSYAYAIEVLGMSPREAEKYATKESKIAYQPQAFGAETKAMIDKASPSYDLFNMKPDGFRNMPSSGSGGGSSSGGGILGWLNNPGKSNTQKAMESAGLSKAEQEAIRKRRRG